MMSGAFVLDDERTANYREFYRRRLSAIGMPTLVFSVLYIAARLFLAFFGVGKDISRVKTILMDVIAGKPYGIMWFLDVLVGLYLLSPIVVRFKDSIAYKTFRKVAILFLIWANVSAWTGEAYLAWDAGSVFEYLGYFMMGYVLRRDFGKDEFSDKIRNNRRMISTIFIAAGVLVELGTSLIQYVGFHHFETWGVSLIVPITSASSPTITVASVLLFAGFSLLRIPENRVIGRLSKRSFLIYLIHGGVLYALLSVYNVYKGMDCWFAMPPLYWVPIFTAMTFVITYILSILYEKIWDALMAARK